MNTPLRKRHGRFRPQLESLENRYLPAVKVTRILLPNEDAQIKIVGTAQADRVTVDWHGSQVQVSYSTAGGATAKKQWPEESIDFIRFDGNGGNDFFKNQTFLPCVVLGGPGKDTLTGGDGEDHLYGGAGHDKLYGRNGTDWLTGDGGSDFLDAGSLINSTSTYVQGGDGPDYNAYVPFANGATLNDIRQSGSPTCTLLATLGAVTRIPGNTLTNRVWYNGDHQYTVRVVRRAFNGQPPQWINKTITFNGTLQRSGPASSWDPLPRGDEFWTVLFQRAYLQEMAQTGLQFTNPSNAYYFLGYSAPGIGIPTKISPAMSTYLQSTLYQAILEQRAVVAGTRNNPLTPRLVGRHAYTVLDYANGVVTLRNPWGRDGGTGFGVPTDGIVEVSWAQFVKSFSGLYYNTTW